jgi:hypothetical protein
LIWKVQYNRQQGVSVFGHIEGEKLLNLNYWILAFMGTGRGSKENDDKHLMYPSKQLKKL